MVNIIYLLSVLAGVGISIISFVVAWNMVSDTDETRTFQRAGYLFLALIAMNSVHLVMDLVEVLKK